MFFPILSIALALLVLSATDVSADQLRYSSARDWRAWQLPRGAVEVMPNGSIQPVRIEKDIDATSDALDLGGGIRRVGSNPRDALQVLDGDPTTGWAPDPLDDPDTWFIEVDLGRSVSARSITLHFAADAPPFELFDLLLTFNLWALLQTLLLILNETKVKTCSTMATASRSTLCGLSKE